MVAASNRTSNDAYHASPKPPRETMDFDVVIVGAGPAGLAAACRLGQLAAAHHRELGVCVVEKSAAIGGHIVSGAVFEPRALAELFPDWRERGAPVNTAVSSEALHWLVSERRSVRIPHALVPRLMRNHGNYIISLGRLCQWMAEQAEGLGCHVLPGFAANEVLYDEHGAVRGVATSDIGVAADGSPKPVYQRGVELNAKYVIFAEGCRGGLGKQLDARFKLRSGAIDPPHYAIGFKEIWNVRPERHAAGTVTHTAGWPLDNRTQGGGFLYHAENQQVFVGLIVALNYRNPHLDPFAEFQRWKQHPVIRSTLEGGTRTAYGARALSKGGLQSLPRVMVTGALLAGCEAGFLNSAKIKGSHTAMKTGILAAEAIFDALQGGPTERREAASYEDRVRRSWVFDELHDGRNFNPGLSKLGTFFGSALAFLEQNLLRGRVPYTLRDAEPDHATLRYADRARRIAYPKPDGVVSFDRLSSVYLSNTNHEEDQPCHLRLTDPAAPLTRNLPRFDEPAQRYCPAGVYEIVRSGEQLRFQINAQNCVHCKTCDIKDPEQNITWVAPEGGGGPNYAGM